MRLFVFRIFLNIFMNYESLLFIDQLRCNNGSKSSCANNIIDDTIIIISCDTFSDIPYYSCKL